MTPRAILPLFGRLVLILPLFLLAAGTAVAAAANEQEQIRPKLNEAKASYDEALELIKKNDKTLTPRIIGLLKASRQGFLGAGGLTEAEEVLFSKVNSLLYWQHKFSRLQDEGVAIKQDPPETKPADPKPEARPQPGSLDKKTVEAAMGGRWEEIRKERNEAFAKGEQEARGYEKEHADDHYNNMMNYLHLLDFITDKERASLVFDKSEAHFTAYQKEMMATLRQIPDFDVLRNRKDYATLKVRTEHVLKNKLDLSPKARYMLLQQLQEYMALQMVVMNLKRNAFEAIPANGFIKGFEGVVTRVDDDGITLLAKGETVPAKVSWEVVDEQTIMNLALYITKDGTLLDINLLSILHLRLGHYAKAFRLFSEMIIKDPSNILRYKGYLQECDNGYRREVGRVIETELEKARGLAENGMRDDAMIVLRSMMRDYLQDELAYPYLARYYMVVSLVVEGVKK